MNARPRRCTTLALVTILGASGTCVAASGCDGAMATQTVIRFSAAPDLDVPVGSTIAMEVWGEGVRQHEAGELRGPAEFFDDIKLTVNARGDDPGRRFTVFAELREPGGERISWARVRTGFLADQLGEVRVVLASECPDPPDRLDQPSDFDPAATCGSHDTCVVPEDGGAGTCAGACMSVEPFSESLRTEASAGVACPDGDCAAPDLVDLGWDNSCVVVEGDVFCWGRTSFVDRAAWYVRPSRIFDEAERARPDAARPVVDLTVNIHQVCVLESSGAVRCGGTDRSGQLGVSTSGYTQCCTVAPDTPVFSQIVSGGGWVAGLTRDEGAILYTGAHPVRGGVTGESVPPYRPFQDETGFEVLYAGRNFFTGFQGGTFRWFNRTEAPALVRDEELEIEAAGRTLCAISNAGGQLRCWGEDTMRNDYPEEPRDFGGGWAAIALSEFQDSGTDREHHHRCAVREDGSLWCWGVNDDGQLGIEEAASAVVAEGEEVRVGDRNDWVDAFVGRKHSCAMRQDGSLWCWGRANEAQLGSTRGSGPEPSRVCVPRW